MKCYKPWYSEKRRQTLPCGRCAFCVKKQIDAWCLRIMHEMEVSSSAYFLTLTYNDEHLPENNELSKKDIQKYTKRVRKRNLGLRYFLVGEYGPTGNRPHYHAVFFNLTDMGIIQDSWKDKKGQSMGFVTISPAKMGRVRYMVSYMALPQDVSHRVPPFRLMSRKPGIGFNYVKRMKHWHNARSDGVVYVFNTPNAMPRYYKDKIFGGDRYMKRIIQVNALAYTAKNPQRVSEMEHEILFNKLNRKNK